MRFSKPPKTFKEQIELLKSRGMIIGDYDYCCHHLAHLNYYRLAGYWLSFQKDRDSHQFNAGTRFEEILNIYMFDKKLRLLLLNTIERVEVSVRTQWAYHLAVQHGPHAYLDESLFFQKEVLKKDKEALSKEIDRSHEIFIKHYKKTYEDPILPPIWSVCEVMSLGLLSRFFGNLKQKEIRKAIANTYDLDDAVMESLLHHLAHVRNLCAHHSRIWNRRFTVTIKLPRSKKSTLVSYFNANKKRERNLYNTLIILIHLMNIINPSNKWRKRLLHLIAEHKIDVRAMGFPIDYMKYPVWRV
uniref:Abortive infection bacteriophage resistance protein n=1 Tax=Candidatus Kentrum sp. LPFa TaxID=2126335 RepID=A0A450WDA6_9GAMM|nr:MAG: Abortive infection bacteriophage resistance protein [Candidatus Kentron sp. LPFa]